MSATALAPPRAGDLGRGPYRLAQVLVGCTLVLIALGGMVTSTGSGMAFRDWPLANGSLWPENMSLAGFFEHVHRAVGALVGLLVLALTIWIGVRERQRRWLRRLAIAALAVVVAQGVIGGVGVLKNLPAVTSVTHGVLAQITLCLFAFLAYSLSPSFSDSGPAPVDSLRFSRKATALGLGLVLVQLLIGAIARHTGMGHALWTHVGLAFVVFLVLLVAAGQVAGKLTAVPGARRASSLVIGLLSVQVLLGFVALLVRTGKDPANIEFLWRSSLITAHVLVGALLSMATALLVFRVWCNARPAAAPPPAGRPASGESRE